MCGCGHCLMNRRVVVPPCDFKLLGGKVFSVAVVCAQWFRIPNVLRVFLEHYFGLLVKSTLWCWRGGFGQLWARLDTPRTPLICALVWCISDSAILWSGTGVDLTGHAKQQCRERSREQSKPVFGWKCFSMQLTCFLKSSVIRWTCRFAFDLFNTWTQRNHYKNLDVRVCSCSPVCVTQKCWWMFMCDILFPATLQMFSNTRGMFFAEKSQNAKGKSNVV